MNTKDIDRIHEAGLITAEQRTAIIEHFRLDRQTNKLLIILGVLGSLLVSAGLILVMAANWNEIPRGLKLAAGLAGLVGAHVAGWRLARSQRHPALAQAMHLTGSLLFLANIGLIGQVYNLSSRPPNAILLWWLGIAPLAWLLKSRVQHVLTLLAFGLWLGMELESQRGWIPLHDEAQLFVIYALLGAAVCGWGTWLSRTRFAELGPITEKLGLIALHVCLFPLTLGFFYEDEPCSGAQLILPGVLSAIAFGLFALEAVRSKLILDRQWRIVWPGSLCGAVALAWLGLLGTGRWTWESGLASPGWHWLASIALFSLCLVQVHVGLLRRAPWMVNLALTFVATHAITAFLQLFGSMMDTGLVFVVGGVFLLGLAFYLERKRRALLARMKDSSSTVKL
jgi:uncharacterized membrane protein